METFPQAGEFAAGDAPRRGCSRGSRAFAADRASAGFPNLAETFDSSGRPAAKPPVLFRSIQDSGGSREALVGYHDRVGEGSEQRRTARGRKASFLEKLRGRRSRRRDDEAALREAYDAHAVELFRFALRSLGDRGLAEEVAQETFVRAWRSRERFDERRGSLRTWLFSIARNLVIDAARARRVRPAQADGEPRDEADVVEAADEKSLRGMLVADAMARLSEDHRVVIREIYLRDRKYDEVAEELGVPPGTLRSRAYYALKSLRLVLEEMGWPDER